MVVRLILEVSRNGKIKHRKHDSGMLPLGYAIEVFNDIVNDRSIIDEMYEGTNRRLTEIMIVDIDTEEVIKHHIY